MLREEAKSILIASTALQNTPWDGCRPWLAVDTAVFLCLNNLRRFKRFGGCCGHSVIWAEILGHLNVCKGPLMQTVSAHGKPLS